MTRTTSSPASTPRPCPERLVRGEPRVRALHPGRSRSSSRERGSRMWTTMPAECERGHEAVHVDRCRRFHRGAERPRLDDEAGDHGRGHEDVGGDAARPWRGTRKSDRASLQASRQAGSPPGRDEQARQAALVGFEGCIVGAGEEERLRPDLGLVRRCRRSQLRAARSLLGGLARAGIDQVVQLAAATPPDATIAARGGESSRSSSASVSEPSDVSTPIGHAVPRKATSPPALMRGRGRPRRGATLLVRRHSPCRYRRDRASRPRRG